MIRRKKIVKDGQKTRPFFSTHDLEQVRDENDELTGEFKERAISREKHQEEMKEEREKLESKKPAALERLKKERKEDQKEAEKNG